MFGSFLLITQRNGEEEGKTEDPLIGGMQFKEKSCFCHSWCSICSSFGVEVGQTPWGTHAGAGGQAEVLHSTSGAQVMFFPRCRYRTNGKEKKREKQWEEYSDTLSVLLWNCLKVRTWSSQTLRYQTHHDSQAVSTPTQMLFRCQVILQVGMCESVLPWITYC